MNIHAILASLQGNTEAPTQGSGAGRANTGESGFLQAFTQAAGKSVPVSGMPVSPSAVVPESSHQGVERHLQALGLSQEQLQRDDMQAMVEDILDQPALLDALETLSGSFTAQTSDRLANMGKPMFTAGANAAPQGLPDSEAADSELDPLQEITQRLSLVTQFSATPPPDSSAAEAVDQPRIAAALTSADWANQLGQQLARMAQAVQSSDTAQAAQPTPRAAQTASSSQPVVQAQLQLTPAERGPLTVTLASGDQSLQATFASAEPQVRQAIEQAAPQLREALAAAMPQASNASMAPNLAGISIEAAPQATESRIAAPLTSADWVNQLGQQLARMAQAVQSADTTQATQPAPRDSAAQTASSSQPVVQAQLQLTPAERGPLTVTLASGDQGLQATFASADPQVRQAIEQAAPQLREALATAAPQPPNAPMATNLVSISIEAAPQQSMQPAVVPTHDAQLPQRAEQLMAMLQSVAAARQHPSGVAENRSLEKVSQASASLSSLSLSSSGGLNGDSTTLLDATQRPHSLADSGVPPTRGSSDLLLAALNAANMSGRTSAGQDGFELPTQGMNAQGLSMTAQANATGSLVQAAQGSLQAPLNSAAWPRELGQQLVQFAQRGGEQQIKLNIHPAELGPLSVSLKMSEQGTQAHFLSAHSQVRQVIEQAIPQLREALAEQGIMLADTSVGEQRQQEGGEAALADGGNGQGGSASGPNESEEPGDITSQRQLLTLDGRVDLYA
ncbi:MAG: flagellar hook-length control protein FliK [Pseudomonadota bacterium]